MTVFRDRLSLSPISRSASSRNQYIRRMSRNLLGSVVRASASRSSLMRNHIAVHGEGCVFPRIEVIGRKCLATLLRQIAQGHEAVLLDANLTESIGRLVSDGPFGHFFGNFSKIFFSRFMLRSFRPVRVDAPSRTEGGGERQPTAKKCRG